METNLLLSLKTNGIHPFSYSSLKSLDHLSPVVFSLEDLEFTQKQLILWSKSEFNRTIHTEFIGGFML